MPYRKDVSFGMRLHVGIREVQNAAVESARQALVARDDDIRSSVARTVAEKVLAVDIAVQHYIFYGVANQIEIGEIVFIFHNRLSHLGY